MSEADIPWEQVRALPMPTFLERFTLHDSWFRELSLLNSGRVEIGIGFDLHWNASVPRGFDTLVIAFEATYSQHWVKPASNLPTLDGAESAILPEEARERLLDDATFDLRADRHDDAAHPAMDPTAARTRFTFAGFGRLELLHPAPVRCVVVDADGRWVDLATVEASRPDDTGHG